MYTARLCIRRSTTERWSDTNKTTTQPRSLFERVVFTSSMDHTSVQMNRARDQVFKHTLVHTDQLKLTLGAKFSQIRARVSEVDPP